MGNNDGDESVIIQEVFINSIASKLGLLAGDKLLEINQKSIAHMTASAALELFRTVQLPFSATFEKSVLNFIGDELDPVDDDMDTIRYDDNISNPLMLPNAIDHDHLDAPNNVKTIEHIDTDTDFDFDDIDMGLGVSDNNTLNEQSVHSESEQKDMIQYLQSNDDMDTTRTNASWGGS